MKADYLGELGTIQGGRCATCPAEIDISEQAYVDAIESERDLRLLCAPCAVERGLAGTMEDPAHPGQTLRLTQFANIKIVWHGIITWGGS
jgi:hypothetical protein